MNIPHVLYAGFIYNISVEITQPSKFLKVKLDSTQPYGLVFEPSVLYFNSYDFKKIYLSLSVISSANIGFEFINVTHEESGATDYFRQNLPRKI